VWDLLLDTFYSKFDAKYSDNPFLLGVSLDNDGNSITPISHKFFSLDFYPCRYDGQLHP